MVQNLGVRTAEAKRGALEQRFEAVGAVAFNERGVVQLQARAAGSSRNCTRARRSTR